MNHMKKLIYLLTFFLVTQLGYSQILNPIEWSTTVESLGDNQYELISTATIDPGWHLYSQEVPEEGPIPTYFSFVESDKFELIGSVLEEEGHTIFDSVFEMEIKYFENSAQFVQKIKLLKPISKIQGAVEYMVCDDSRCLAPTEIELDFYIDSKDFEGSSEVGQTEKADVVPIADAPSTEGDSLWATFLLAFVFGFAALLTPCVFPMIPLTVSFFTKQSKSKAAGIRNALIYGISIVVIYVILGTAVTAIFGASALNALSTNVWFNLLFFLLLVVFAVSFLGAFEITLPSSWGNKVDEKANKGGFIGIFFMALALAIVSFSCTGPIVGTLLVQAASGGSQIGPIVGMLGFSLAIALPFTLFAAFPGWMNSLPKSGGWLNTVKVVLGFLELAFALKFLSNADLVLQLHFLEREVFLAFWIAIFLALSFYLFGAIKLPHDGPEKNVSVGRVSLGILSLTFSLYMLPGLWGAPLKLISAFPPPQHYSESPYGVGSSSASAVKQDANLPEGAHYMAPYDILTFNDYELGMAYAKKVNKPVMLDFTGHACVNCRKMEQNVWVDDKVLDVLKNKVVLISLFVDDKRPLPPGEALNSQLQPGKKLKYIGQKWSEFQTLRFKANSQPYYVLLNGDESLLNKPVGYTPNIDTYYNWLIEGIGSY
jgi:thiol:disulfide interchange protein DsbD